MQLSIKRLFLTRKVRHSLEGTHNFSESFDFQLDFSEFFSGLIQIVNQTSCKNKEFNVKGLDLQPDDQHTR